MDESVTQIVERRRRPRFDVVVPVVVGDVHGRTRDLSTHGAYLEIEQSPRTFTPISFTLDFEAGNGAGPIRYHCAGTVVRVHPRTGSTEHGTGVAVRIELVAGQGDEDGWLSGRVLSNWMA